MTSITSIAFDKGAANISSALLEHSAPLNFNRDSSSSAVSSAVDYIFSSIAKRRGLSITPVTAKRQLKLVLLNLLKHWKQDPTLYTAVSLNKTTYKANSRYNPLRISENLIPVVKSLAAAGYVVMHKGFHNRDRPQLSKMTRIRATPKLIRVFEEYGLQVPMISVAERCETIVLRSVDAISKKTIEIEYKDCEVPEFISRMRTNLAEINANLEARAIVLEQSEQVVALLTKARAEGRYFDLQNKQLRRIFNNGSWDQGGRFYGAWWINAPKVLRRFILIDGEPTTELDYSGIHLDLLYAMEGVNYHKRIGGDPYLLPGLEEVSKGRDLIKAVVLILINAESRASALAAIRSKPFLKVPLKEAAQAGSSVEDIVFRTAKMHEPISRHFCSGGGLRLQRLDAEMAENVILNALRDGITVLPIHDSFISQFSRAHTLYEIMVNAYRSVVGSISKEAAATDPYPRVKFVGDFAFTVAGLIQRAELINIAGVDYDTWEDEEMTEGE